MSPTRRRYLATLAGVATVVVTGCSDDDTGTASPSTTAALPGQSATPTPTPATPTATTTDAGVDVGALRTESERFVRELGGGDFAAAIDDHHYTDAVAAQLDAAGLEQFWTGQTQALGAFTGIAGVQYTTSQGYHVLVVTAIFTEGRQRVRLVYDGEGRIAGLQFPPRPEAWSPPGYADRSTFTETEITLQATDACTLGATLTVPNGDDTVPGVVLVHGSGPNDRDETIGPNKPFTDLAWGLASRGVAVLRYDKRTGACQVDPATLTIDEETTDDAVTAVARLESHDRVSSVFVVGHSLGGMVAPRIAARAEDLAGIAMLAAPARSLPTLIRQQTQYLTERDGTVTDSERRQRRQIERATDRIRDLDIDEGEVVLGGGRPYWRSLQNYDQVATARALSLPRLVLQGGRDYQVTPEDDFRTWRDALDDQSTVRFEQYPQLNHLFMTGEGQPTPEEYYRPGNVARVVVADLAGWIEDVVAD